MAMLHLFSGTLTTDLRAPRTWAAAAGVAVVAAASIAWYRMTREEPDPTEMERERREYLASAGRIVDGSITETHWSHDGAPDGDAIPSTLIYRYRIAGVTYECAQDVSPLTEHVRHVRIDLPVQVRFDPRNPGDSIVVAEGWSGLRVGHEQVQAPAPTPAPAVG